MTQGIGPTSPLRTNLTALLGQLTMVTNAMLSFRSSLVTPVSGQAFAPLTTQLSGVTQAASGAAAAVGSVHQAAQTPAPSGGGGHGGGGSPTMGFGYIITAFAAIRDVGATIEAIKSFETAMAEVEAVTGATGGQLLAVQTAIRDFAKNSVFSATEVAGAMAELSKAGLSAEDAIRVLPDVMALATAGTMGLREAVETTVKTITSFELGMERSQFVVDTIGKAAAESVASIESIGSALSHVSGTAHEAGFTLTETAAAIAVLSNNGIDGSRAGTGLRSALASLLDPSKEATKALRDMGLTIGDVSPQTHTLEQIIRKLTEAGMGADDAFKLFTTRGAETLIKLAKDGGTALHDMKDNLQNVQGTMDRMAQTMTDTWEGATKRFKNAINEAKLAMSEGLTPALAAATNAMTDFVNKNQTFSAVMSGITTGTEAAVGALGSLGLAWLALGPMLPWLQSMGGTVVKLSGGFAALGSTIAGWGSASGATLLALGPLALAIAGLGALLYTATTGYDAMTKTMEDRTSIIENHRKLVADLGNQYDRFTEKLKEADEAQRTSMKASAEERLIAAGISIVALMEAIAAKRIFLAEVHESLTTSAAATLGGYIAQTETEIKVLEAAIGTQKEVEANMQKRIKAIAAQELALKDLVKAEEAAQEAARKKALQDEALAGQEAALKDAMNVRKEVMVKLSSATDDQRAAILKLLGPTKDFAEITSTQDDKIEDISASTATLEERTIGLRNALIDLSVQYDVDQQKGKLLTDLRIAQAYATGTLKEKMAALAGDINAVGNTQSNALPILKVYAEQVADLGKKAEAAVPAVAKYRAEQTLIAEANKVSEGAMQAINKALPEHKAKLEEMFPTLVTARKSLTDYAKILDQANKYAARGSVNMKTLERAAWDLGIPVEKITQDLIDQLNAMRESVEAQKKLAEWEAASKARKDALAEAQKLLTAASGPYKAHIENIIYSLEQLDETQEGAKESAEAFGGELQYLGPVIVAHTKTLEDMRFMGAAVKAEYQALVASLERGTISLEDFRKEAEALARGDYRVGSLFEWENVSRLGKLAFEETGAAWGEFKTKLTNETVNFRNLWSSTFSGFQDTLGNFLVEGWKHGWDNATDVFKNFKDAILDMWLQAFAKMAANSLLKAIIGDETGSGLMGVLGGVLAGVGKAIMASTTKMLVTQAAAKKAADAIASGNLGMLPGGGLGAAFSIAAKGGAVAPTAIGGTALLGAAAGFAGVAALGKLFTDTIQKKYGVDLLGGAGGVLSSIFKGETAIAGSAKEMQSRDFIPAEKQRVSEAAAKSEKALQVALAADVPLEVLQSVVKKFETEMKSIQAFVSPDGPHTTKYRQFEQTRGAFTTFSYDVENATQRELIKRSEIVPGLGYVLREPSEELRAMAVSSAEPTTLPTGEALSKIAPFTMSNVPLLPGESNNGVARQIFFGETTTRGTKAEQQRKAITEARAKATGTVTAIQQELEYLSTSTQYPEIATAAQNLLTGYGFTALFQKAIEAIGTTTFPELATGISTEVAKMVSDYITPFIESSYAASVQTQAGQAASTLLDPWGGDVDSALKKKLTSTALPNVTLNNSFQINSVLDIQDAADQLALLFQQQAVAGFGV